jgi:hypothetical protein
MASADAIERYLSASIAANTRWAQEPDRTRATSAGRAAFDKRFEDAVDPERTLSTDERAKRVANARRAYFIALALKSAKARKRGAA